VADISVQPAKAQRKFNGQIYVLTKINFDKEAADEDEAYHKKRGRKVKTVQDGIFWLLYTKLGQ
jgi:hypothetical protein